MFKIIILLCVKLLLFAAFDSDKMENMCHEELQSHGFNYLGKDFFYNGMTGQPLEGYIYSGPVSFS